jgi:hypothetical protein
MLECMGIRSDLNREASLEYGEKTRSLSLDALVPRVVRFGSGVGEMESAESRASGQTNREARHLDTSRVHAQFGRVRHPGLPTACPP